MPRIFQLFRRDYLDLGARAKTAFLISILHITGKLATRQFFPHLRSLSPEAGSDCKQ